ncbi:MAG: hypothetical protein ABI555_10525 [Chloroflexota bacterium]
MTRLLRNLRPLLVGVVALFLTAGIAFAARPATSGAGTETGAQASGQQGLSSRDGTKAADADEDQGTPEVDTDTETEGAASDNADHCTTNPTTASTTDLAALTHGQIVCWAAHQKTFPATFKNHGAWVSSFAHKDHGANASATGKLKSADGRANAAAKSNGHSHSEPSSTN